jgi:hypothetical protein
MTTNKLVAALTATLCCGMLSSAFGSHMELGLNLGGRSLSDHGGTHTSAGLNLENSFTEATRGFVELNFSPLGSSSIGGTVGGLPIVTKSSGGKDPPVRGRLRHYFKELSTGLSPHLVGTSGAARWSCSVSGNTGGLSSFDLGGSVNSIYLGGGGELRYDVNERWSLRPELRYQRHFRNGGGSALLFMLALP